MPEGDTIFRAARTLNRALAGKIVTAFRTVLPKLSRFDEDHPITGRVLKGKGALLQFDPPYEGFGYPVNGMGEYELIRPYLFTRTLRFSHGFNSGRPREMWQHELDTVPLGPNPTVPTSTRMVPSLMVRPPKKLLLPMYRS